MEEKIKRIHESVFNKLEEEEELIKDLTPIEKEIYHINKRIHLHSQLIHTIEHALLYKKLITKKDLEKGLKLFWDGMRETKEYVEKLKKR